MGVRVLAVETSCDETAAAVVEGGRRIVSNVVASQADRHRLFGGVVPEVASRRHMEAVLPVIAAALERAGGWPSVGGVAATAGPGLVGALLVGFSAAKALAFARGLPFVAVNHLEGHVYSNLLAHAALEPPFLCLIVSGGHTDLVHVAGHGDYRLVGATRDDAAGEAFDKIGRLLGLPYPAGPALDRLARAGDPAAIPFPRAWLPGSRDFSFSGLKTAVVQYLERERARGGEPEPAHVAASVEAAIADVLAVKAVEAARDLGLPALAVAGGVAANTGLRRRLAAEASAAGLAVYFPPPELCTDNAAMIAAAACFRLERGEVSPWDADVDPNLALGIAGTRGE